MPRGSYLLAGGVRERFSCAPGPAGWRYAATREDAETGQRLGRLDLVLDPRGSVVRLEVVGGGWELRGGAVGPELLWRRGDDERSATAAGFTGTSPAFAVATTRLLALTPDQPRQVHLVKVDDAALATLEVDEGWVLTAREDREGLPVDRYEVADLATGERRVVHLAGDVVLEQLEALDGPPTLTRP